MHRDSEPEQSSRDGFREATENYRSILEATMDGFWIVDMHGRILEVNEVYCRMSGYSRNELLEKFIPEIEAKESPDETAQHIERIVARGSDRFETRHRTKSGGRLDVEARVVHLRESGRFACFLRDVTERNRTAEHGQRTQERLQFALDLGRRAPALTEKEVFDLAVEKAVVLTGSRIGYLHTVNDDQVTLSMISWSRASLAECTAAGDRHYPIEQAGVWADSVRLRQPVIHNDFQSLTDRKGYPEGHSPVRRHMSIPVFDGEKVVMVAGVGNKVEPYDEADVAILQALMADVLQIVMRKRAGAALRESEERFRVMADTAPVLIWQSGTDKLCTYFNRPWLDFTGRPIEKELGNGWAEGVHPEDLPRCLENFVSSFDARREFKMEYRLRRADGEYRWVVDNGVPIFGAGGEFAGYIGSCIDITDRKRVEDKLRLHEAAIEAAANAIVLCDRQGTILFTNAAFTMLTGWEREEALGQTLRILKSGIYERSFYEEMWETVLSGKVWRGELTNRRKDGTLYVEEMTITPLLDATGEVTHLIAIKQDAEWRREADRRVRTSEERYRELVQGLDAIVFEVDLVAKKTTFVSDQAQSILGYPIARWLDDPSFFLDHIHPEDRGLIRPRDESFGRLEADFRVRSADGRWIWFHGASRFLSDPSGKPTRHLGVMVDVTRHRELEQAVRAAAEEWSATFDALEAALLVLDSDDRVIRLNRAAANLLGATWKAVLGQALAELGKGEPWLSALDATGEVRREGQVDVRRTDDPFGRVWNVDATRVSRAGTWDGRVIVSLREVSQLVKLQESVRRAEAMATLGSIVGAVAHEVRNPLFAMSVNIDALAMVVGDRSDARELLDALCHERDRTAKLMDDLLHYGRPASSRRLRGTLEPVLASSVTACGRVASRLGLTIERTGSAAGLEMLLDADRLEEVFENLLENACQHSPRGATVSLDVRVRESGKERYSRCTVRDRGRGFSPDVLTRVFEPFFSERKGGIGLGLAIVQRIVEEHGGQVLATNAPDGGAEVIVDLPLLAALPESGSE